MSNSSKLTLYRGDSKDYTLLFKDAGEPVDITGWTVFFTVKKNKADSDANSVLQKNVTSFTNPSDGIAVISLSNADTDTLKPGNYVYDIQIKKANGKIQTLLDGTIAIKEDVTRRTT